MEADWEVEVGGGATVPAAPVIEALWPRFVDLRTIPKRAWQLPEAVQLPAMAETLIRLNAVASPVWTSKCDFWPEVTPGEFDPDELDAPPGSATHAAACYIDLLPRGHHQWHTPAQAADWCKGLCSGMRTVPLRCCRVDLVVRQALISPGRMDLGITAYLTACGPSPAEAKAGLKNALAAFADALCGHSTLQ